MGDELKPCPFCGSENVTVEIVKPYFFQEYARNKLAAAGCRNCGASTKLFSADTIGNSIYFHSKMTKDVKEKALERARQAWNRMASNVEV